MSAKKMEGGKRMMREVTRRLHKARTGESMGNEEEMRGDVTLNYTIWSRVGYSHGVL